MVGAALLILQRRCRGRGGRIDLVATRYGAPEGRASERSSLRWRSHRACGRKLRLAGGKKEEQPP